MEQAILSIQSFVSLGHVGNRAACWALERLGLEVWPVPTVWFAHHPGYGPPAGSRFGAEWLQGVLDGLLGTAPLERCGGILTGYLGGLEQGPVVLEAVARLRGARLGIPWLCDPVLGEEGRGLFVPRPLAAFLRDRLVPAADIVTPNLFELGWLTDMEPVDAASARRAARQLRARGPHTVLATGVPAAGGKGIGVLLESAAGSFWIETPRLACRAHGTGDLLAAFYLGRLLRGDGPKTALEAAVSVLYAIIEETVRADAGELRLPSCETFAAAARPRFRALALDGRGESGAAGSSAD